VYARLSPAYGWRWEEPDGTLGPFVLGDVERYAGMLTGFTPDGRKCARPQCEFDALSHDGEEWHPTAYLLAQVPREGSSRVRIRDLSLPVALDQDQDGFL
jgi:hypothetical protein